MLHSHLKIFTYTPTEVSGLEIQQTSEFIEGLNQHDLCVIGGGGLYSKYFLPMNTEVIKSIEIPIALYGIGYLRNFGDEELTEAQIESVRLLSTSAKLTSVRDEYTCNFLRGLGIGDIHVIGDPAIFLRSGGTTPIILDENKTKIGVNVACHGWTLYPQYLNRTIEEYIKVCEFLIEHLNAEIVYLKHHVHEDRAIEPLKKKLPIKVASSVT